MEQGTAIPGHQGQNLEIRVLLRSAIDCVVIVRMCTGDASAHVHWQHGFLRVPIALELVPQPIIFIWLVWLGFGRAVLTELLRWKMMWQHWKKQRFRRSVSSRSGTLVLKCTTYWPCHWMKPPSSAQTLFAFSSATTSSAGLCQGCYQQKVKEVESAEEDCTKQQSFERYPGDRIAFPKFPTFWISIRCGQRIHSCCRPLRHLLIRFWTSSSRSRPGGYSCFDLVAIHSGVLCTSIFCF